MRIFGIVIAAVLLAIAAAGATIAFAQFPTSMMGAGGTIRLGAQPQPTAITLTSGSAPDTSASGALIATINSSNVTMSLGGTFGGTCTVTDTNTTGPGPGGAYVASGGASGCNIVTAAAYSSANDGTHGNITLKACQNSGCASQAFTLTIGGGGGLTPPAEAQMAGFTTLAANYDFSQASWANIQNLVQCSGTSIGTGILWALGSGGTGWPGPCPGPIAQTTDQGFTVLVLPWEAAWSSQYTDQRYSFSTVTNGGSSGYSPIFTFPMAYVETVDRLDTTCASGTCGNGTLTGVWTESAEPSGGCCLEIDFGELYSGAGGFGDAGPPAFVWVSYGGNNLPAGWAPTSYHKYGVLITGTGNASSGNILLCYWVDDVFQFSGAGSGCSYPGSSFGDPFTNLLQYRSYLIFQNQAAAGTPATNFYMQYIRVWSCSTWQTDFCIGTTLQTGANGLQYYNNPQ